MTEVEVGQVRISSDGKRECDVNERLGDPSWYVCRLRVRGSHGAPLHVLSSQQVHEMFPAVVSRG